jgi:hypothetical protein
MSWGSTFKKTASLGLLVIGRVSKLNMGPSLTFLRVLKLSLAAFRLSNVGILTSSNGLADPKEEGDEHLSLPAFSALSESKCAIQISRPRS